MTNNRPNPQRERIIDLARTGLTSGQIATALGVTRNTVIGICWRSGVPLGNQEQSYRSKLAWLHRDQRLGELRDMIRP